MSKKKPTTDKRTVLLVFVVVVLVLISGVQAIELAILKNKINTLVEEGSFTSSSSVSSSSSTLQKNLQNLPSMVGGC